MTTTSVYNDPVRSPKSLTMTPWVLATVQRDERGKATSVTHERFASEADARLAGASK